MGAAEDEKIQRRTERRKLILAFVMLMLYVTLFVTGSQLSSMAFMDAKVKFRAPFLFTLFKVLFRVPAFPLYLLVNTVFKLIKRRKLNIRRTLRRSTGGFHEKGMTWWNYVVKFAPPVIMGIILQTTFTLSTANIPTAAATALYSVAVVNSYILSWLVMKQRLLLIKSIFVAVSFGGVALIAYASFVGTHVMGVNAIYIGVACGLAASLSLSFYQLSFKRAFPKSDLGQTLLILSIVSFAQACLFWPVPVILKFTGYEEYSLTDMPWGVLVASWSGFSTSTMAYTYGLALSSPFFMSIAELLNLSANSLIDPLLRNFEIRAEQIAGTCLIAVAFIVMIMPDRRLSVRLRKPKTLTDSTAQFAVADLEDNVLPTSEMILPVKADLDLQNSNDSLDSAELGYTLDKY